MVPALHVNGPTGAELGGIYHSTQAIPASRCYSVRWASVCVVGGARIEARYRYAWMKRKLSIASTCLVPWRQDAQCADEGIATSKTAVCLAATLTWRYQAGNVRLIKTLFQGGRTPSAQYEAPGSLHQTACDALRWIFRATRNHVGHDATPRDTAGSSNPRSRVNTTAQGQ